MCSLRSTRVHTLPADAVRRRRAPRSTNGAPFERIELDDDSWVDIARDWLLGADTLLDVLIDARRLEAGPPPHVRPRARRPAPLALVHARATRSPIPRSTTSAAALDAQLGVRLFGPACNYYRDGNDSVAWHADRELRELTDTRIAILTLGARRPFLLRPKGGGKSRDLAPGRGDLLVMGGACQMRLGARGAEDERLRPARLVLLALDAGAQSPGVVILMTLNIAPAGSASTAKRPGSMSIGPCITVPPLAFAISTVLSVSSTAK